MDLAAARLAVATRAIDGYAETLATGVIQRDTRGVRLARLVPRAGTPVDALVAGAATASMLAREAQPINSRRAWRRVRAEVRRTW